METKKSKSKTIQPDESPDCVHHWIIEAPSGPVSKGTCRNCEEIREFRNSVEFSSWYGARPSNPKTNPKASSKTNPKASSKTNPKASPKTNPKTK